MQKKLIGRYVKQPRGYRAFIPKPFPSKELVQFSPEILRKSEEARARISRLDGIAHHIPDMDFFILMYLRKDATASSQIEGTRAGFRDVLESNAGTQPPHIPDDVEDIHHYIKGLNAGIEEMKQLPLSGRVIKLTHKVLSSGARTTQTNIPGMFRTSQNWIGGRTIAEARFVPPPHTEIARTIGDVENFIHAKNLPLSPVIQAALIHAQFETIHPFLDGNGRTGRMLITLFFMEKKVMEKPLLYLSHYFRKHRKTYYELLSRYSEGDVDAWVDFFLDAIIEIAEESITTAKQLAELRDTDRDTIATADKRSSENMLILLKHLYGNPITTIAEARRKTNLTRSKVRSAITRMVELDILRPGKAGTYEYRKYIDIFTD